MDLEFNINGKGSSIKMAINKMADGQQYKLKLLYKLKK